jgi:cell division protein FtsI/penicillin-binding protein 2/cell division protein FtsW (lipid II flippase)
LRTLQGNAFDVLAVLGAATLVALGALNLEAVSGRPAALRQVALGGAGLVLLVVFRFTRLSASVVLGWACYAVSVVLLGGVALVGVSAHGARRWLALGSLTFEPSELAALGLLLLMAHILGATPKRPTLRRSLGAVLVALVPICLTVLEPDLSTAAVLVAVAVAMLVLGRVPARFLLPLFGGAVLVAPLAVELLRPYQLARLHGFVAGTQRASGSAYSIFQSHIAVASGGLLGQSRTPVHRLLAEYLPDRSSDLALASVVEQWGLAAGAVALLAAALLVWRLALASRRSRTRPAGLFAAGLAVLIGVEAVVSVGGNLGRLPLAGVPFPLLSLGGSALVVVLAAVGLALGARRDAVRRRLWSPPAWATPKPRWTRVAALTTSGLLVLFGFYGWQLWENNGISLRAAAQTQMTRCIRLPAPRGLITDRHGAVLATNIKDDDIDAIPSLLLADPASLQRLASVLGRPVTALRAILVPAQHDLTVKVVTIGTAIAQRVAELRIPSLFVLQSPRRVYPYGPLLAPLLGFVGLATPGDLRRSANLPPGEVVGRSGIEEQYDPILRGLDGKQCLYVDPSGVPVALASEQPPVPGDNLQLSIDLGLQQQLTADLAAALAGGGGRPAGDLGGVVALDPRNGQVLAMASLPSYDDNIFGPPVDNGALTQAASTRGEPTLEHATQAVAPPGSTFKLVVAATDVVDGVVPPDEVVPTGATFTLAGHVFHGWADLAPMDLAQSVAWSNDVYFYKLALALGADRIHQIGSQLGVGQRTGIDLPGESSGYFGSPASVQKAGGAWYAGSTVILGIGQGYLTVTPLQDAIWTAAVSTGAVVTPRIGLALDAGPGSLIRFPSPPARPLPFATALRPIQAGMVGASLYGTAAQLANLATPVAAKTGSAQDPSSPNGAVDSWLTAAAPFPDPTVVMTSLVRGGGEGATTSGPLVDRALRYFLAHEARILSASVSGVGPVQVTPP